MVMARLYLLVMETILSILETVGQPQQVMVALAMTPSTCQFMVLP